MSLYITFTSFPNTMRVATLVLGLLATAVSSVSATALTYKLGANEKACFYTQVDQQNAKVAFYFAVSAAYRILPFVWLFCPHEWWRLIAHAIHE